MHAARAARLTIAGVASGLYIRYAFAEEKKNPCRPLVLCGPSGAGKSTLIARLQKDNPEDFGFSISHTTRKPRGSEKHGVEYYFTDKETMQKAIDNGEFIESAHVHSNIYGTSKEAVTNVIDRFLICILDIDVQGVRNLLKYGGDLKPIYVFIAPPSIEELERRLRARATDSEETIKLRLANAEGEMKAAHELPFDKIIVNNSIDQSYEELKAILKEDQCACQDFRTAALAAKK